MLAGRRLVLLVTVFLVARFPLKAAPGPVFVNPGEDWDEITNIGWKLELIVNHKVPVLGGIGATIQFSDERTLEIGPIGSTMMECAGEAMDLEVLYLEALGKVKECRLTCSRSVGIAGRIR